MTNETTPSPLDPTDAAAGPPSAADKDAAPEPSPGGQGAAHSAAASVLGYLHQTRWGLLELLRQRSTRPDASLTLEMYDDIAWEQEGSAQELKQLKLHANGVRTLGDSSADLWRTIGVWVDNGKPHDPYGPLLTLVTNSKATPDSVAALLRGSPARDVSEALRRLEDIAETSTAQATSGPRRRFLKLDPADRASLVSRIFVADGSADLDRVDEEVAERLRPGAPTEHFATYLDLVWSWWATTSLALLRGQRAGVSVGQMRVSLEHIRDQFSAANLPALVDVDEIDIEALSYSHNDRVYVHQLRLIQLQARPIEKAILDYQRAYLQETRWLERHFVDWDEIDRFARRLIDEWERAFDFMCSELPSDATDEDKQRAGRRLLHELSNSTLTIRARFEDPFFARGHRHGLSDLQQIGWHPDFRHHLETLLLDEPAAS